jgi:Arc/MetJ-type ribon-helix-helix transcriptional regulator
MMIGMTPPKGKIAVSLSQDTIDDLHRAVDEGMAPSASAFVDEAVREKLDRSAFGTLLAEMLEETGGPLTEEEIAGADARLGL